MGMFSPRNWCVSGGASGGSRRTPVLAWLRLLRVASRVESAAGERLRGWGLNNAQFDVLAHVGAAEGITQQELADTLLVTKGNVAQLLARMEERGWILRQREGRTNKVLLTDRGWRLFKEVVPAHEAFISDRLSVLSHVEQRELHRLLRKLDRSLD